MLPSTLDGLALTFDPVTHTYRHGPRLLISVTQALTEAGIIENRWYTDGSAQRGSFVHRAIALYCQNDLRVATLDPALRPYFDAYLRFATDTGAIFDQVERQVCDLTLGYAGTFDALGTMRDRRVIVDFKTGACPPWAGLQLAAYRRCLPEPHLLQRYSVELRADASYRLQEWTGRTDEAMFLSALAVARWKRLHA